MKTAGKIQMQFKPKKVTIHPEAVNSFSKYSKERNYTYSFTGWWQFVRLCLKAYKQKPDKVYIFFN